VKVRSNWMIWIVMAAMTVLLLVKTGDVALIDPDEGRFARTTVEMSRSGDLVVPTFEGRPRLVKPPLLHWIQLPLFGLFGANEITARIPSAMATLGMLLITAWAAWRRFGPEGAVWSAAFLGSMPLVVSVGRLGTLDALLSVHVMGMVALDIAEPKEAGAYRSLAMGALMGMAFLAKGPIGIVLPLLIILAGRTFSGREILPRFASLAWAVAGWCAVVLPWGLVFLKRVGLESSLSTLRTEGLDRFFSGTVHVEPPWYYAGVVLIGFFPWIAPLCIGMFRLLGRWRDPAARTGLYAYGGLLAGLLFFTLCKGKLANYILPLTPLAAILVTWELGKELDDPGERRLGPGLLAGTLAGFAVLLGAVSFMSLEESARWCAGIGSAIHAAAFVVSVPGVLRHRPRWVYGIAATASAAFLLVAWCVFMPDHASRRSARNLVRDVPELSSGRPVGIVEMELPSLTFYLDPLRPVERLVKGDLEERTARNDRLLLILDRSDLNVLSPEVNRRLTEVGSAGKYIVFETQCTAEAPSGSP
jgi:4-amino-4-deoxy-L-arabinose transferase-like glycosyltransferase